MLIRPMGGRRSFWFGPDWSDWVTLVSRYRAAPRWWAVRANAPPLTG